MFDMFLNSVTLFFKGKLFQDMNMVIRQTFFGVAIAAALLIIAVKAGLTLWIAVLATSLISGAIQPLLFKNLKYR
tara:strand:- start:6388 stop:6612 length:225 start_codon:yes stop_codon:yes gene_type:complete